MKILCVAATAFEIKPLLLSHPATDHLITGIGSPIAMYHIMKRLQQIDYDLVVQAGIAGSFDHAIELGEVVEVTKDNFADLGINEQQQFSSLFDVGFMDANEFPFTNGWLENNNEMLNRFQLAKKTGITVNGISDNVEHIAMLKNKYSPDVESMEGAALHYVCLQENIPFIQLRSLSNYVGERDKTKWKTKEAIHNLNIVLQNIISLLS